MARRLVIAGQFGIPAVLLGLRWAGHEMLYGWGWQMFS
jgi:hypothetical protein